ncbi:acetyl-CoA synthetase-like protein [Eremomyces bilateralis CBS 781.70]|uniref:Acetyl-CoA synthetase-like protein n=1 Tax=Eremomyces bilateralis CBS 781.70 TaxID=1392243 RepID=A0A6G1GD94_9PEZI|nr:acetyl-CoA synthetase-like protein [Eremomyces bilateralis CBS 781.70]KAF1815880.1 acetyl-CoA synthetase-like protein [Eremomyces bilateralis CBS 781.70]
MPVESSYPPFEVPTSDLWTFLFERKEKPYGDDKLLYIDPSTKRGYTYAQCKDAAKEFGMGLKALWDWEKGDVLALYTPNCIDTPAIMWGCHWAGGVLSPANPAYTVDELAFQLKDSGARALVTQLPFIENAKAAAKKAGIPEDMVILMGDARDSGRTKHFTSVRNISRATRYRKTKIQADKDLAFLVYSSGTMGYPKGVMLTHTNIVSNILMIKAGESGNLKTSGGPDGQGDKILAFLPFFHIYGLTCLIHQSMYSGITLVVMEKFELERFCQIVQEYKISFVYMVPPIVLALSKHPIVDKYDLSSIRMINSGAAPLTHDIVDAVYKRLKVPIKQGYGLSETSPTTHTQPWEDWNRKLGSVGRLLPNQTAKYMDETGTKEVPAGTPGELWIKGPNIFKGYLNKPELTAEAIAADGYFKTGDVGYVDDEGNFYITDRVKELIKYKGFQVAPAELEGTLTSNDMIQDAGVIGVYDASQATELPIAFVVPAAGVEPSKDTEQKIVKWLEGKVAPHKRLRGGVRFVEEIPKSASGKILRRILKEQLAKEGPKSKL